MGRIIVVIGTTTATTLDRSERTKKSSELRPGVVVCRVDGDQNAWVYEIA